MQTPATQSRNHSDSLATNRPNILLLMSDQHRGDCVGADGNEVIATPHLDRLAREGAWFRSAYSSTPTCTPARAALLTGLSPWNHGMLGYSKVAEEYPLEMPQMLRDAGYYTAGIGKMHWHPQRNRHGFHQTILDESGRVQSYDFKSDYRCWFSSVAPTLDPGATGIGWNDYRSRVYALPEELHPTRWTGDVAVNFLENYEREKPFFLKVSFARPHSPYDPPERLMNRYSAEHMPPPFVGEWSGRWAAPSDDSFNKWHGNLGREQALESRQGYYGSVTFIDEQIGRIVDALEQRGELENTLILYVSDHGDMLGDHYLWRKSYAYEGSARIPFLVRWPGGLIKAERGQTRTEPVEIRDILPTFLDAANAPGGERCDGESLLGLLDASNSNWREWLDLEHYICYGPRNHWNALTDGKIKYIFHAYDGEEQLFDLERDPGETTNLALRYEHLSSLKTWRARMVEHLSERGPDWVKDGRLVPRPEGFRHSPNYPAA